MDNLLDLYEKTYDLKDLKKEDEINRFSKMNSK